MTGEEYETLGQLESKLGQVGETIRSTEGKISQQQKLIAGLGLPENGVSAITLGELEDRISWVENQERILRESQTALQTAEIKRAQALEQIAEGQDTTGWEGLTVTDISRLDQFLRQAHLTLSEKQALESLVETLRKEAPAGPRQTTDQLNSGIRALSYWLQQHQDSALLPGWWLWLLTSLSVITAFVVYIFGPYGLLGLVVIGCCAFFARGKRTISENPWQREYITTGLQAPATWDRQEVIKRMDELVVQLKELSWQDKISVRIEGYLQDLEDLTPRLTELEHERSILQETLKLIPQSPDEKNLKGFDALFWLLKCVGQWQESHNEVLVQTKRKEQTLHSIQSALERINDLFATCNAQQVVDGLAAKAVFRELKESANTWQDARKDIEHHQDTLIRCQEQKTELENKMKGIYTKLGVPEDNKEQVYQLTNQLPDYREANQEQQAESRIFLEREQELKRNPLYEELGPVAGQLHYDQAQEKIRELSGKIDRLDDINQQITAIETRIAIKKEGSTLEEASLTKEEALDGLVELFDTNLSAITGKFIVERLKKQAGDENRPPVFRRAKEIFNRITNGRYELIVQEGESPSFKAYDTVLRSGLELSELSTGTRTQLLLAVRLAFIEIMETTYRVPILADELLANSDDNRSKAIIEALSVFSGEGRQIFYFTAQMEEVYKWKSYLEENPGVSYKIFHLDGSANEVTNISGGFEAAAFQFLSEAPEPAELTHTEYGELLGVDSYNLLTEPPATLHLWYLIDDTCLLADLLKRGIKKWGQLHSFIECGGKLSGCDENLISRLKAKSELLERYLDLYRQGRPRPIDRAVLEQSGAVSPKYIDALTDKLSEVNGNPQMLLQALKNRQINGFRTAAVEELEQFLAQQGYINNQDIIPHSDIVLRLSAYITNSVLSPCEAEVFINRVVKTI